MTLQIQIIKGEERRMERVTFATIRFLKDFFFFGKVAENVNVLSAA